MNEESNKTPVNSNYQRFSEDYVKAELRLLKIYCVDLEFSDLPDLSRI
jgi:hypothetical protein